MARASYSTTPLLRSLVHRPQGVILVLRHLSSRKKSINLGAEAGSVKIRGELGMTATLNSEPFFGNKITSVMVYVDFMTAGFRH